MDADGDSSGITEWSLVRWDVSSIDTDHQVQAANFTFNVNNASDDDYNFYAVTQAWIESQATFNHAAYVAAWRLMNNPGPNDTR